MVLQIVNLAQVTSLMGSGHVDLMTITDLISCTMDSNALGQDFLKGIVIVLCVIVFVERRDSTTFLPNVMFLG